MQANSTHRHLDNNNKSSSKSHNPSMIFRIEHLLPHAEDASATMLTTNVSSIAPSSPSRRPSLRSKRGGVFAAQFLPKDTVSEDMQTLHLMNEHMSAAQNTAVEIDVDSNNDVDSEEVTTRAHCSLTTHNMLNLTPDLLRRIKLSEDIHSYNALFELSNGNVRVRIVRDIASDDELIGWFNEEITLLMAMPFLTPLNIQGNKRYTCHLCRLTFETPNPLKIHLALGCGHYSMDILWIRLHYAIKATQHTHHMHLHMQQQQQQQQLQHQHPLLLPSLYVPRSPPRAASSTSSISPASTPPAAMQSNLPPAMHSPPTQRFSAFKPISPSVPGPSSAIPMVSLSSIVSSMPSLHASMAASASTSTLSFLPSMSTSAAVNLTPHMSLLQPPSSGSNPLNAAAQIEAIVSNMGSSKQGHLCIYCGKIYSRKYGLKIHIRTHTGFKPLKCKFCLRPFGDPSNLNKHVRLHLQSQGAGGSEVIAEGYKCHLCQKTLARRRDLQRHIESRHGTHEVLNLMTDDKDEPHGSR